MKALVIALLTLLSLNALADNSSSELTGRIETWCNFQDCAHEGWETRAWTGSYHSETSCTNKDCFGAGYFTRDDNGATVDVTCLGGDCWANGWHTTIMTNSDIVNTDTYCNYSSCLKNGWRTIDSHAGLSQSACYNNDCSRFGWESWGGGRGRRVQCKMSDCFRYGWTVDTF